MGGMGVAEQLVKYCEGCAWVTTDLAVEEVPCMPEQHASVGGGGEGRLR